MQQPRSRELHRQLQLWESSPVRDVSDRPAVRFSFVRFRDNHRGSQSVLYVHRLLHRSTQECTVFVGFVLQPDVDVNAVGPHVDVVLLREVTLRPCLVLIGPLFRSLTHAGSRTTTFALSPLARSPTRACRSSEKSPVEIPFRYSHVISSSSSPFSSGTAAAPAAGTEHDRPSKVCHGLAVDAPEVCRPRQNLTLGKRPIANNQAASLFVTTPRMFCKKVIDFHINRRLKHPYGSLTNQLIQRTAPLGVCSKRHHFRSRNSTLRTVGWNLINISRSVSRGVSLCPLWAAED